jgi:hypothetical protein
MKLNFKKIASVLASTVMLTSTIGFAAAATYPAPFSSSGGAVVYGAAAAKMDVVAAYKVENSVKGSTSTSTTASTTGETIGLFTDSTRLYVNDSMNVVKQTLTRADLPTLLAKGSFSGNVDANYDQSLVIASVPTIKFGNMPTSSDPAVYALTEKTSAGATTAVINATVTFSKAVAFNDTNSKNQEIILFGQKFTVGASTDANTLVLFKSASKLSFDSTGTTSGEVTINGKKYTVELVSASGSGATATATIQVTGEDGTSEQKDITVGNSKKVNGVSIAVNTASSNNQKYIASVVAGAEKINLPTNAGAQVTTGDSGVPIDGTAVYFTGGTGATTAIVISISPKNDDSAALLQGQSFTDPVFGTFKLDFSAGMNIGDNDTVARETLELTRSADDKFQVRGLLKGSDASDVSFSFLKTQSDGSLNLQSGDSGYNISVKEGETVYKNEYMVVGNQDSGALLKVYQIYNSSEASGDYSLDRVQFQNVATGELYDTTITARGVGTLTVNGKQFAVTYSASPSTASSSTFSTTVISTDSSTAGVKVFYPTIQSSLGAKVAFYEPETGLNLTTIGGIRLPNGDGFTTFTINPTASPTFAVSVSAGSGSVSSAVLNQSAGTNGIVLTAGKFTYNLTSTSATVGALYQLNPETGVQLTNPGMFLIEGKDDNNEYQGLVMTFTPGQNSTTGTSVNTVARTWTSSTTAYTGTVPGNSYLTKKADLFGSIITTDTTTVQKSAKISYPKSQVYGNVFVGSTGSLVTGGTVNPGTGALTAVEDSEIASVSDKNLIVVGGSCVNKAAAKILGSENPLCGADFTAKTQVGSGQYIIKTVKSPYNDAKIAVLVAGYEAVDTTTAVNTLLTGAKTDVDSSQVYPIVSTSA